MDIHVAAIAVDIEHAAERHPRVAGVLLMRIRIAFRSVGRGRLFNRMMGQGIYRYLK